MKTHRINHKRESRKHMTAEDRLTLRYIWFVAHPRITTGRIAAEFGIVRSTLHNATANVGLVKTPELFEGPAPGRWFHKLITLYDLERKPTDDTDAPAVYLRAAGRGNEIIRKVLQEEESREVIH